MRAMADNQPRQSPCGSGLESIARTLQEMKFRRKLLAGVDEADVWRKLGTLQEQYETAYRRQEAYYQALLEDRERALALLRAEQGGVPRG